MIAQSLQLAQNEADRKLGMRADGRRAGAERARALLAESKCIAECCSTTEVSLAGS